MNSEKRTSRTPTPAFPATPRTTDLFPLPLAPFSSTVAGSPYVLARGSSVEVMNSCSREAGVASPSRVGARETGREAARREIDQSSREEEEKGEKRTQTKPRTGIRHPASFDARLQQLRDLRVDDAAKTAIFEGVIELCAVERGEGGGRGVDGEGGDEEEDDGGGGGRSGRKTATCGG